MKHAIWLAAIILLTGFSACAQKSDKKDFRIAFYNVENLFDTIDAPDKQDEEYTPFSDKQWTSKRYYEKLNKIARVLGSLNPDDAPELIGLCEVENEQVVTDLVTLTELKENHYKVVHDESPDVRGIDVALIYDPEWFTYKKHESITVTLDGDRPQTRDILYVQGEVNGETLHVFVNHWPSRSGGQERSEPNRIMVAEAVRKKVDELQMTDSNAKIVLIGDLNDHPIDKSVFETLNARANKKADKPGELYNLLYESHEKGLGSYSYKGQWGTIDHVIVSHALLNAKTGLSASPNCAVIHKQDWFLYTTKGGDQVPSRTYGGDTYYGGFSDHLPVMATFELGK